MMKNFSLACLALSLLTGANASAEECNLKKDMDDLINGHGAIRTTKETLVKAVREVPGYTIGGSFYPAGQKGEDLRADVISIFGKGVTEFSKLVRVVAFARNEACELCDLRATYASARDAGYKYITRETLTKHKDVWSKVVDQKKTLQQWEERSDSLRKQKEELEKTYPDSTRTEQQRQEIDSIATKYYDAIEVIGKINGFINELLAPVGDGGRNPSQEGRDFAKRMNDLKVCVNMDYQGF